MKAIVLSYTNNSKLVERWKAEGEKLNVQIKVINPLNVILKVSINLNGYDAIYLNDGERLFAKDFDFIIPRISNVKRGINLVRHINWNLKKYTVTTASSLDIAANKFLTHQILSRAKIRNIESWYYDGEEINLNVLMEKLNFEKTNVMVAKRIHGSQGKEVETLRTEREIIKHIKKLYEIRKLGGDARTIFQPFVETKEDLDDPESQRCDFRIVVIDGEIVAAIKRYAPLHGFKANLSGRGVGEIAVLSEEQKEIAKKAALVIGSNACGVDLLYDTVNKQNLVIELNSNFGFKTGIITGVNLYDKPVYQSKYKLSLSSGIRS